MSTCLASINKKFARDAATVGLRQDGRELLEMRKMKIIFNQKNDGVEISMGNTVVYAKVTSKVIEPSANRPQEGKLRFVVNLRLLQDTPQAFTKHRGGDLATEITKILERNIVGSSALDRESLCIQNGNYAWDIQVELSLLNNDGNLLDCFNFAALVALTRYKVPFVTVERGKLRIWSKEEKREQSLSIHHWPICMTFGVMNEYTEKVNDYVVYDPSVS